MATSLQTPVHRQQRSRGGVRLYPFNSCPILHRSACSSSSILRGTVVMTLIARAKDMEGKIHHDLLLCPPHPQPFRMSPDINIAQPQLPIDALDEKALGP